MLSRVADSLYWISRYLERAEHTARLVDLNLLQMLDQSPEPANLRWDRVLDSLDLPWPDAAVDVYTLTKSLTFDTANRSSILGCIASGRENARQVREQISSEMWEQLNRLFLHVKQTTMEEIWSTEPHEFFQAVKEGVHLFQGITDSTMSHGEGWQFIQIGRYIERAGAIANLIDVYFTAYLEAHQHSTTTLDYFDWVGLLKSCTAFESYNKVYTADMRPDRVAEFLLFDAEFPHSVGFAAHQVQAALRSVARTTGARNAGRAERLAGRLCAVLDYTQIDEVMSNNMHIYLEDIRRQCLQIHNTIYQIYIAYPIDAAFMSSMKVSNQ